MTLKIRDVTTKQPVSDAVVLVRQDQFFLPFPPYETLPFSLATFERPGQTAYGTTDSNGEIAFTHVTSGPAQIVVIDKGGQPQSFYADAAIKGIWSPMGGTLLSNSYEIRVVMPTQTDTPYQTAAPKPPPVQAKDETPQRPTLPPTGW